MDNPITYRFNPNQPGIIVEIYLPKKSEYQGALYFALTEGFKLDEVKNHFRNKEDDIRLFLDGHYNDEYTDARIENMTQIFDGYSMYEVDGVFYDSDTGDTIEERTQVIRIFFRPDLERIPGDLQYKQKRKLVKDYLRFTGERDGFAEEYLRGKELSSEETISTKRVVDHLRGWECEVALFVFGYIVYEICRRIQKINEDQGKPVQKEILVTSLWNLTTNRVVNINNQSGNSKGKSSAE